MLNNFIIKCFKMAECQNYFKLHLCPGHQGLCPSRNVTWKVQNNIQSPSVLKMYTPYSRRVASWVGYKHAWKNEFTLDKNSNKLLLSTN